MIKVYKFGGSVLKDYFGFKQLEQIVRNSLAEKRDDNKIVIVISAFGKTTANLNLAMKHAEQNENDLVINIVSDIFNNHKQIVKELELSKENTWQLDLFFRTTKENLLRYLRGVAITHELTARTKDIILSFGEMIASRIISIYLTDKGITNSYFNITKVLITDDNFGAATPNLLETQERISKYLLPVLKLTNCMVTQGFIASSMTGEITTMGIESSNLTATILAGVLHSEEFVIWTDVEGIRSADPKLVKNTKLIKNISYEFADLLAAYGLKLIYPKMIDYLRLFDLELQFRSGLNLDGQWSVITRNGDNKKYKLLLHKENTTMLHKEKTNTIFNLATLNELVADSRNIFLVNPDNVIIISDTLSLELKNALIIEGFICENNVNTITGINISIEKMHKFFAEEANQNIDKLFINYNFKSGISSLHILPKNKEKFLEMVCEKITEIEM